MTNIFSEKNLLKIAKTALYFVLATPFLAMSRFMFPYITSKAFFFNIIVEFAFAAWLGLIALFPRYRPKWTPLNVAILAFLGILFIASIFGVDFHRSFWSTQERTIGLLSLCHFAALYFTLSVFDKEEFRRYLKVSFWASAIMAVFAIIQFYYPSLILAGSTGIDDRAGSFFGNPTFLAAYLSVNIFLGLWFLLDGFMTGHKKQSMWYAATVLFEIAIIIFATQTRGAMLGILAGFIGVLGCFAFLRPENYGMTTGNAAFMKKASAWLIAIAILFSGAFIVTRHSPVWSKVPGLSRLTGISISDSTTETRLLAWGVAFKSFEERPILGFGWENFKYPFDRNFNPKLLRYGVGETYWDKPHNIVLEYLVVSGVLGLAAYLTMLAVACYLSLKNRLNNPSYALVGPFIFGAIVSYFVQNLFVFDTFGSYLMLFIIFALLSILLREEKPVTTDKGVQLKFILLPISGLVIIIGLFVNISILKGSNDQFWIANNFINNRPAQAIAAFEQAKQVFNPYVDYARKDFFDLSTQIFLQDSLPDPVKNLDYAAEEMKQVIKNNPLDYYNYFDLGDQIISFYNHNPAIFQGHEDLLKTAEDNIMVAIRLAPNKQEEYYSLARLDIIEGKNQEALDTIKKMINLDPDAGDPHFFYGLFLLENHNSKEGFAEIDKAASLGRAPRTNKEYRILANYYGDAGYYARAAEYYNQAVKLDPTDMDSALKLGIVFYYGKQNDSARVAFMAAIKRIPDFKSLPVYQSVKPILMDLGIDN